MDCREYGEEEWEGGRQLLNVWHQSAEGLLNVAPKEKLLNKDGDG